MLRLEIRQKMLLLFLTHFRGACPKFCEMDVESASKLDKFFNYTKKFDILFFFRLHKKNPNAHLFHAKSETRLYFVLRTSEIRNYGYNTTLKKHHAVAPCPPKELNWDSLG